MHDQNNELMLNTDTGLDCFVPLKQKGQHIDLSHSPPLTISQWDKF